MNNLYEKAILLFEAIALHDENIRSVFVFGSRARTDRPADDYSDLDIAIICKDKSAFFKDVKWLEKIGHPIFSYAQPVSLGEGNQIRALFDDARDIDFVFFDEDEFNRISGNKKFLNGVIGRGIVKVCDKDGNLDSLDHHVLDKNYAFPPLTQKQLNETVHNFLFHAVSAQKKTLRGEFLTAKNSIDQNMRDELMLFIRWREMLDNPNLDVWHRARFFETWASKDIQQKMQSVCPTYDPKDISEKIGNNLDLMRELAEEICQKSGLTFPQVAFDKTKKWVKSHDL